MASVTVVLTEYKDSSLAKCYALCKIFCLFQIDCLCKLDLPFLCARILLSSRRYALPSWWIFDIWPTSIRPVMNFCKYIKPHYISRRLTSTIILWFLGFTFYYKLLHVIVTLNTGSTATTAPSDWSLYLFISNHCQF